MVREIGEAYLNDTNPKPQLLFIFNMRRVGLEPTQPKAATGSLVLRVCQFRHPR